MSIWKNIMDSVYWNVAVLLSQGCWDCHYPYSRQWDRELTKLMESERFKVRDRYTAYLGGLEIWISNHPYASFHIYKGPQVRPSRKTILKAHEKLISDMIWWKRNEQPKV